MKEKIVLLFTIVFPLCFMSFMLYLISFAPILHMEIKSYWSSFLFVCVGMSIAFFITYLYSKSLGRVFENIVFKLLFSFVLSFGIVYELVTLLSSVSMPWFMMVFCSLSPTYLMFSEPFKLRRY